MAAAPCSRALSLVLVFAVAGLPPFSGFWPKVMLVEAAIVPARLAGCRGPRQRLPDDDGARAACCLPSGAAARNADAELPPGPCCRASPMPRCSSCCFGLAGDRASPEPFIGAARRGSWADRAVAYVEVPSFGSVAMKTACRHRRLFTLAGWRHRQFHDPPNAAARPRARARWRRSSAREQRGRRDHRHHPLRVAALPACSPTSCCCPADRVARLALTPAHRA